MDLVGKDRYGRAHARPGFNASRTLQIRMSGSSSLPVTELQAAAPNALKDGDYLVRPESAAYLDS
jgi:hypothetical protein